MEISDSKVGLSPIQEIDEMIVSHLDSVGDMMRLIQVNKYFHQIIRKLEISAEMHKLQMYLDGTQLITLNRKSLFYKVCNCGSLQIAKYLLEKYSVPIKYIDDAINISCCCGYLDNFKFFLSINKNFDIHCNNERLFRDACREGHLEVAQFIFSFGKVNIYAQNDYAFRLACGRGHLHIVEWLCQLEPIMTINIRAENESAFIACCKNNYLHVAEFIYKLSVKMNNIIDIHIGCDEPFMICCKKGHVEMAKFIYYIDNTINFRNLDGCPFYTSCVRNHPEVAQWLTTLCPRYKVEITDGRVGRFWY